MSEEKDYQVVKDYKVVIDKSGKFISATTPNGGLIEHIVRGSIQFEQSLIEKANGYTRMKLELFIKDSHIEVVNPANTKTAG